MEEFTPRSSLEKALLGSLDQRFVHSTLRKLTITPQNSVDFSSNDFLSLSTSDALKETFFQELNRHRDHFTLGSGGSRLLDGNSDYAIKLEEEIAAFHNASAGLLWNSGFDANAGLFACIPQPGDAIVYDELIHASVHDGMKMSRATWRMPFEHNCIRHLRCTVMAALRENPGILTGENNLFIAVESVYSMDGDLAPLTFIVDLIDELGITENAHIIVDEAHATGVIGPKGRGLVSQLGLEQRIFARLHTFGKSLACSGAIVLCSPLVRSYLINYARPLIYTTFMPFPNLAAIKASYSLLQSGATEGLNLHLQRLTVRLHVALQALLRQFGLRGGHSDILQVSKVCPQSPIFSLLTPHPRSLAKYCQDAGFVVRAVVPPTVPTRRVRVCLHSGNTVEEIERLVTTIQQWLSANIRCDEPRTVGIELVKARL